MSHTSLVAGFSTEARTVSENADAIAEALRDFPLKVWASLYLGAAHCACGDHRRAEGFLRQAARLVDGDREREHFSMHGFPAVVSRFYLGWSLAERGAFGEAIAVGREGIRLAEAVDHAYTLAVACWRLGYIHGLKGEFDQAVSLLERALARARESSVLLIWRTVTECLGHVHAVSGRVAEGLALLQEAVDALESMGAGQYHVLGLIHLGEAYALARRFDEAWAAATRARILACENGQRGSEAWAARLLGEIALQRDPVQVATAEGEYRQALASGKELGMLPLVAHCHLGLGKLYLHTGSQQEAREHLTSAASTYGETDMHFWLERAEAEMTALT
jgi:tetratricopeptide (TPR) repeat protein